MHAAGRVWIASGALAACGRSPIVDAPSGLGVDRGPVARVEAYEAATLRAVTDVFVDAHAGVWWNLCDGALDDAFVEVVDLLDARGTR